MSEQYSGMTWLDLVRKYFPDANEETCDFILWEKTCFPLGSPEEVETQIQKLAKETKHERKQQVQRKKSNRRRHHLRQCPGIRAVPGAEAHGAGAGDNLASGASTFRDTASFQPQRQARTTDILRGGFPVSGRRQGGRRGCEGNANGRVQAETQTISVCPRHGIRTEDKEMMTLAELLTDIRAQAEFISALQEDPASANAARVILRDCEKVEKELFGDGGSRVMFEQKETQK